MVSRADFCCAETVNVRQSMITSCFEYHHRGCFDDFSRFGYDLLQFVEFRSHLMSDRLRQLHISSPGGVWYAEFYLHRSLNLPVASHYKSAKLPDRWSDESICKGITDTWIASTTSPWKLHDPGTPTLTSKISAPAVVCSIAWFRIYAHHDW